MTLELLRQPRRIETATVARCGTCGRDAYVETIVELSGVQVERVCVGSFRQSIDADGMPNGPIVPFCACTTKE